MKSKVFEAVLAIAPFIILLSSLFTKPPFEVYTGPTYFDGNSAYDYLVILCSMFKGRVVGSERDFSAGYWVVKEFEELGYKVHLQNFTTRGFYGPVKAMNVYAIKKGIIDRYIIIMAHRDIVPSTIEGANDNGAGVAILIELARVFAKRNTTLSIIFLCTDSEETGLHGARFFVNNFPELSRIVCAVSIDMCGWKDSSGISLIAYYYPPKFCDASLLLIALSLRSLKYNVIIDPLDEIMARLQLVFAGTDSMPFIAKDVPAFGVSDYPLYPYWHKVEDTLDKVSPTRLQVVGEFMERLILTIDSMEGLPELSQHYLIIGEVYLPWYSLYLTTLLVFAFTIVRIIKYTRPSKRGVINYLLLYSLTLVITSLITPLCMSLRSFTLSSTIALAIYIICILLIVRKVKFDLKGIQGISLIAFDFLYLSSSLLNPEVALTILTPTMYTSALIRRIRKYRRVLALIAGLASISPWMILLSYVFSTYGYRFTDRLLCYLAKFASYKLGLLAYIALPAATSLILVTVITSILVILKSSSAHEE